MKPKPSLVISIVVKSAGYIISVAGHGYRGDVGSYLIVKTISDIPGLEGQDQPH
jgi:hypothetical protein